MSLATGEFVRFEKAGQLMSYLGLTPSEDTSGEKRRQGAITKTGSRATAQAIEGAADAFTRRSQSGNAGETARWDDHAQA